MNSGVRRTEEWTLYDEQDRPVVVTALVLVFAGSHEVKHWQSGRARLTPRALAGAGVKLTTSPALN